MRELLLYDLHAYVLIYYTYLLQGIRLLVVFFYTFQCGLHLTLQCHFYSVIMLFLRFEILFLSIVSKCHLWLTICSLIIWYITVPTVIPCIFHCLFLKNCLDAWLLLDMSILSQWLMFYVFVYYDLHLQMCHFHSVEGGAQNVVFSLILCLSFCPWIASTSGAAQLWWILVLHVCYFWLSGIQSLPPILYTTSRCGCGHFCLKWFHGSVGPCPPLEPLGIELSLLIVQRFLSAFSCLSISASLWSSSKFELTDALLTTDIMPLTGQLNHDARLGKPGLSAINLHMCHCQLQNIYWGCSLCVCAAPSCPLLWWWYEDDTLFSEVTNTLKNNITW